MENFITPCSVILCFWPIIFRKCHPFQFIRPPPPPTIRQVRVLRTNTWQGLTATAKYLPSPLNVQADWQSRNVGDSSDWKLNPTVFRNICKILGQPDMNLFASRLCHQLQNYISWKPDPFSQGTDALQMSWSHQFPYAFPPFCLISKTLAKVVQDKVHVMILISPTWQTQPWYSQLLHLSIGNPVLLPHNNSILKTQATRHIHWFNRAVSGWRRGRFQANLVCIRNFRKGCQPYYKCKKTRFAI